MGLADWLWLATAVYALHIIEEFALNWRDWARAVIGLPVEWGDFYVVNAAVIVLGVVAANLAASAPAIALGFPALMIINALVFHVAQVVVARGRFSPGLISAVVLMLPAAAGCYAAAAREGSLTAGTALVSALIGAGLMATPIFLIRIRSRPYFRQDRP